MQALRQLLPRTTARNKHYTNHIKRCFTHFSASSSTTQTQKLTTQTMTTLNDSSNNGTNVTTTSLHSGSKVQQSHSLSATVEQRLRRRQRRSISTNGFFREYDSSNDSNTKDADGTTRSIHRPRTSSQRTKKENRYTLEGRTRAR